jgi:glucosamine--fructose-6-phosphate aminotransferase (isomerizing)
MCGIVGYVGKRQCAPLILGALKRLEYRGYDSAGIAVLDRGEFRVVRAKGKIRNLEQALMSANIEGSVGIGHTRWATHGRPSEENAHPHQSGAVVLVHNGIIENYVDLKRDLVAKGRRFLSETDTEVLCHLIDEAYQKTKDPVEATREALSKVHGSYAIAVLFKDLEGTMVVARYQSPLIVGLGDGENVVASDIPAILDFTQDIVALDDLEMALVSHDALKVFDIASGAEKQKKAIKVNLSPAMAEKGGFKHFMLKEIFEQPRAVIDSLRGRVVLDSDVVVLGEEAPPKDLLANTRKVHIIACGTSWHAGLVGRYLIASIAKTPVEVHLGGEFDPRIALLSKDDFVVAISQSGETLDTLRSCREAKGTGVKSLAITNTVASSIARECDYVFYTHAGPEISVASTKAFTTQIVALYLFAIALGMAKGSLAQDEARRLAQSLFRLPGLLEETLKLSEHIRQIARRFIKVEHMLYLGRGILHPVALEGALKMKEIAYIHAEGYSAGEMKHGPIALIDENFPAVILAPFGAWYKKTMGNLEEVKARNGRVIGVGAGGDNAFLSKCDAFIPVPDCPEELAPVVTTIPLQLFAYHMADLRGTDVDQPRNLAKSVTVE